MPASTAPGPLAQAAAAAGKVRLNGVRVEKPGHAVKPGDILTLGRGGQILAVRVLALAERRGSAAERKGALRNRRGLKACHSRGLSRP